MVLHHAILVLYHTVWWLHLQRIAVKLLKTVINRFAKLFIAFWHALELYLLLIVLLTVLLVMLLTVLLLIVLLAVLLLIVLLTVLLMIVLLMVPTLWLPALSHDIIRRLTLRLLVENVVTTGRKAVVLLRRHRLLTTAFHRIAIWCHNVRTCNTVQN